eukprot:gene30348-35352_t
MDFISRLSGSFGGAGVATPQSVFKFTSLDVGVQKHLQKTYATLAVSMLVLALGVYAHLAMGISGFITQIASFGCLIGLGLSPTTPYNLYNRYGLLAGFSFCQGASIGPLIDMAIQVDPSAIITAALATATIFICFTLAAILTKRRSYLYLGGFLSSAISCMFMMRIGSYFFGGRETVFNFELYGGLLVFSAYILFDTQLIVEKAYAGQMDHVKHALDLLVDLIAVFVRVLIILLKNSEKKKEKEDRKSASFVTTPFGLRPYGGRLIRYTNSKES